MEEEFKEINDATDATDITDEMEKTIDDYLGTGEKVADDYAGTDAIVADNTAKKRIDFNRVFLACFLAIFVFSFGTIVGSKINQKKAEQDIVDMREITTQDVPASASDFEPEYSPDEVIESEEMEDVIQVEETVVSDIPEHSLDWSMIANTNPDIYGWIYIPNTVIDYPLLSSGSDKKEDYYLDHNMDGSYGPRPGSIYSQKTWNKTDFSDFNLVLYGHNMKDGSMFADLHKYEDREFFSDNSDLYIYTPNKNYKYKIFAAYETDDMLLFEKYDFNTDFGRAQYLDEVLGQRDVTAHLDLENAPTYTSNIITLSTCIGGKPSSRWLVQAVRVE